MHIRIEDRDYKLILNKDNSYDIVHVKWIQHGKNLECHEFPIKSQLKEKDMYQFFVNEAIIAVTKNVQQEVHLLKRLKYGSDIHG